ENFVEILLFGRETLIMVDITVTLKSRELKKRIEGTKEETSDELYVREKSHHQDSNSSNDEGNTYFEEALVVVWYDEITKLVIDSGRGSRKVQLHDGSSFILEDVDDIKYLILFREKRKHLQETRELDNNIKMNKALEFNGDFYKRLIYKKLSVYDLELL
ncbi:hypothetical protein Tco_1097719, partial [Tanacetum coccineum]